ncbi:hypothetical protein [Phenylobacterium sp.]|uniref:hypothetical protein n=1 Tax=Phenylobacterium sp. TaxID=1871053 RepID=UPI002DEADDD0|nr:hypothetical protein [Phenylobacterium sp.]
MLRTLMILGAAAALMSGPATAQSIADPSVTSICLDPTGHTVPVTCRSHDASRIAQREDICQCLHGGDQVTVPFCPRGVKPPAEDVAFEHARRSAVVKGSLVGATYAGRPICVESRSNLGGAY